MSGSVVTAVGEVTGPRNPCGQLDDFRSGDPIRVELPDGPHRDLVCV